MAEGGGGAGGGEVEGVVAGMRGRGSQVRCQGCQGGQHEDDQPQNDTAAAVK